MPIYDAAMRYKAEGTPLVVIAGKEYGTGSSRDWAAKGTNLLGVRAVIVESFERIHRSNLVGMGVLPLQFVDGETATLRRHRDASPSAASPTCSPRQDVEVEVTTRRRRDLQLHRQCRIDTANELEYFRARRHPPLRAAQARRWAVELLVGRGSALLILRYLLLSMELTGQRASAGASTGSRNGWWQILDADVIWLIGAVALGASRGDAGRRGLHDRIAALASSPGQYEPPPSFTAVRIDELRIVKATDLEQFADMMTWGMIMAGTAAGRPLRRRSTAAIRSRRLLTISR